jgi:hypothetical protein
LFGGDKAEGTGAHTRRQKAEERKDFRQKGGYQGGFGIISNLFALESYFFNAENASGDAEGRRGF